MKKLQILAWGAVVALAGIPATFSSGCDDSSEEAGGGHGGEPSQGGTTATTTSGVPAGGGGAGGTGGTGGVGGLGGAGGAIVDCPPPGPNAEGEMCSPDEDETQCDEDLYCFYPGTPEFCSCCAPCRPWGDECASADPSNKVVHDAPDCPGPGNTTCFLGYCVTWLPD